jgi:hypothetical protein
MLKRREIGGILAICGDFNPLVRTLASLVVLDYGFSINGIICGVGERESEFRGMDLWELIVRYSMEVHIAHDSNCSIRTVIFGDCYFASYLGRDGMMIRICVFV